MSRTFKTQEELTLEKQQTMGFLQVHLPIEKLLLVYGRQSTVKQVVNNRESAQQQAIDLLDYGLEIGWPAEKRLLFIENQLADGTIRNASGRLRIDQRAGLQEVTRLIESDEVGAVLVRAIDRLFRDETMVGPVVFADICKKHHVLILTPDDLFDFSNPKRDDLNRFILEAMKAKDFIEKHVRGVMLRNRERKALRGEYAGHGVPTGLMLDDERKHYIANPLWAPVIADMLKRYRELDGNFAQFRREVAGKPILPELPEEILERTGRIYLLKVDGGYTVNTWSGLRNILTNVALIGHTAYRGRVIKNTHHAIVDEADFWYAFERLNKTDLEGNPTEYKATIRYVKGKREPHLALLDGTRANGQAVITSPQGSVYIFQRTNNAAGAAYAIRNNRNALDPMVTSIRVSDLDNVFIQRLLKQLEPTGELRLDLESFAKAKPVNKGEPDTITTEEVQQVMEQLTQAGEVLVLEPFDTTIEEYDFSQGAALDPTKSVYAQAQAILQTPTTSLVGVDESIAQARKEHARLTRDYKVNFDLMTDNELRENRQARARLTKDIAAMEKKKDEAQATLQDVLSIEKLLQDGYAAWVELPLERQRRFIRLVTKAIVLEELEGDWLKLTVRWQPYPSYSFADTCLIYRQNAGKEWTEREDMLLLRWYSKASRAYLLDKLPNRTWAAITSRASNRKLKRRTYVNDSTLPPWLSLADQNIFTRYGLTLERPTTICCWWLEGLNVWSIAELNLHGVS